MQVYGMEETPVGTPDAIHGQRATNSTAAGAATLPHAKAAQVGPQIFRFLYFRIAMKATHAPPNSFVRCEALQEALAGLRRPRILF